MTCPRRHPRAAHAAQTIATALTLLLAVGCGAPSLPPAVNEKAPVTTPNPPPSGTECTTSELALDETRSYAPAGALPGPNDLPAGSTMAAIRERGRLVVGVSADTYLFGARNALTGEIEGFDIDVLIEVANAIFGDDGRARIEFRVMPYSGRLPALETPVEAGGVDIVAHTMTITCNRWNRIAFSSTYYLAGQKVLVRADSGVTSVDQLVAQGATVCAPAGSTNLDKITEQQFAGLTIQVEPDITDCLVSMQQGRADAATGDDTVLAGLAAQDPSLAVVGEAFTEEPYGLGMSADQVDFVQFVNAVLDEMREDGRWADIYTRWLIDTGVFSGDPPEPPSAVYGREP